jgi:steroid delta-isomerase-like uncharacterized protein
MTTSENISLAKRWYQEVWNEGRNDTIHELMAPDAVLSGTDRADIYGPVEFEKFAEVIRSAFPDTQVFVDDVFGCDDQVAIRWHAKMTHSGEMLGIPATGKSVEITGMSIARISNGKIVAGWDNWDRLAMLEQIGVFTADTTILTPSLAKSA